MSQEAINLLFAGIGILLANFIVTLINGLRSVGTRKAIKETKAQVVSVQAHVDTVKSEIPSQVQTHIEKPLSSFQEQIDKSLANLASTGTTFAFTMNDIVANYQNQATNYERQIALIAQQLQHTLDQNRQLEKQLFDHKVFAEDLQKGRAADFERIRAMELKQRQMEEIQQAQAEGSKARDKRIKELHDQLDEERRQNSEQRAEQTKLMDVMRNEREIERQRLIQEIADMRSEVDRLRGIEGERQLLVQKLAALQEQSDGDRARLTDLLAQSERDQRRITELEQEVARLKSNGVHSDIPSPQEKRSHDGN